MVNHDLSPWAALLLRAALGIMFLAHSLVLKLGMLTLSGTAEHFASLGLPGWLAYLVFITEALGGLLLVIGVRVREVALALSPILIGAAWAHWDNGWLFLAEGGGWEYPVYLFVLCIAQSLLGEGRLALSPSVAATHGFAGRSSEAG